MKELRSQKVVNLVELKVLLNPRLVKLKELLDECKTKDCPICRSIKEKNGIITKI